MFELRVITLLAHTNWLAPNLGTRNDLEFEFHQTLTLAKGQAAPDYSLAWCLIIVLFMSTQS